MDQAPDLQGWRLGDRYELEEPIASGGMASVWRARDLVLGRSVAVKLLRQDLARDEDLLERFRIEAVAAARLSNPAVVRVFDTGVHEGMAYIVMELFEGTSLLEVVRDRGALPPEEAVRIVDGALQGLAHAHEAGVTHRDVKPANILVGNGLVKVTDFGIAKAAFAQGDLTTTGNLLGTARYLAPEQVGGGEVDARADLYSAGVVLYELLTGRPPFEAETHLATATMRLTRDPTPPRALRSGIPRGLEAVVLRALARDPDQRFQDAQEMRAALERAVPAGARAGRGGPRRVPATAEPSPSIFRSWFLVPILLAIVAALGIGTAALLGRLPGEGPVGAEGSEGDTRRVRAVAAADHDPLGDGVEQQSSVPLAIDGDPTTAWETEGYQQADLGGLKDGVGLVLDLGRAREIVGLRLVTFNGGWAFEIKVSDHVDGIEAEPSLASLAGQTSFRSREGTSQLRLEEARGRYLLIWITEASGPLDDGKYRATVAEAEPLSPRA